jgi:tRNA-splicing ligase RtcB (3'-phosphate/5'-hydroxy nucleic acid ligase)
VAEHAAEYEWRGEGEDSEIVLYAPDDSAFERALPAGRLPGVRSPVYAAASPEGLGWVAASATHAAPDLLSAPRRGLLLAADTTAENSGIEPRELTNRLLRDLPEAGLRLPRPNEAGVARICEVGASAAAEDGLIEEEDLAFFETRPGDGDALGRRALAAGPAGWEAPVAPILRVVVGVLEAEGAESLGLQTGVLVLIVEVGAGELGRLALAAHRKRILGRIWSRDFGAGPDLPAAPAGTEEAADLVAALNATANFADTRAARTLWMLRRSLREVTGGLEIRAAWILGGIEEQNGLMVHRKDLASAGDGEALVSGGYAAVGKGKMWASAPPFGVSEEEGRWPWEEAGLMERWAELGLPEG